jgi:DNA repair exonuclease SbcCD nuclease subunit
MIFITGDCHADFHKFSTEAFPEQAEMTKDDIVIILGDFGGIWNKGGESNTERYWLKWLNDKPFTTVFIDGNHENFDRLNSEYAVVEFHGGKAHKIRDSIYHLMRGEIFDFEGKSFFAFGGASSHDIDDGILSPEDFATEDEYKQTYKQWVKQRKIFRVNRLSWWAEELPSDDEIQNAETNLAKVNYKVDYVISHCAPQSVVAFMYMGATESDKLTLWFEELQRKLDYKKWFFGHYHEDRKILDKYVLLYDQIVRIK